MGQNSSADWVNPSETEFLIIGLRDQLSKLTYSSDLVPTDLPSPALYTSPVRNLGVIFDKNLSFADHITKVSQICYMHIRDLRRLRPILDYKTACTIATSIVHSKLDFCNSLFTASTLLKLDACKQFRTILTAQSRNLPNMTTTRWSSGINAANGARGPQFASRILPTVQQPWTSG